MTALATLDDLKHNGIEVTDEQTATSLLDSVSEAVRSAAGCPITLGEWTVDIPGEQSRKLDLPCRAVRSVSKVLIDGKTEIPAFKNEIVWNECAFSLRR